MLMGGSVPLLARRSIGRGVDATGSIGGLYGWNTVGAAAGAGLATYGLLPGLGLAAAIRMAAAVNLLIGAAALYVDARARGAPAPMIDAPHAPAHTNEGEAAVDPVIAFAVLQAFALSGFAAIAYEVTWARLLALIMGSSVYAFGTLVIVILAGLGLGSAIYARLRLAARDHLAAFALVEFLVALGAAASLFVAPQLPALLVRFFPVFKDAFGWQIAAYVVFTGFLAFGPALLLGASFPAVFGSLGGAAARLGRTFGLAYASNTAGTVLGAFLAGFVLIPAVGLRATIVIGMMANLAAGLLALVQIRWRWPRRAALLIPAVAALVIALTLPPWPREVFAAGVGFFVSRFGSPQDLEQAIKEMKILYYKDGINTTISVDRVGSDLFYRSNGKTDASTQLNDMTVQHLLGHLPMLRHPAPADVFVLGLGTAVTAAAVARYPVRRIDLVELEPAAVDAVRFFERENRDVLSDPRVRLLIADGRNRLRASADTYDVIISDPSDIWVAGTGSLFTAEFYQAAAARLRPGGVMVQWIHTHALAPADLLLLVATFHAVFPHTEIWTPAYGDVILMGAASGADWDYPRLANRYAHVPGVQEDLRSIGLWHPLAVFAAYAAGDAQVRRALGRVTRLHTDDRPTLEFRTPRSLYADTMSENQALLDDAREQPFPSLMRFDPARDLDADATYLLGFGYAAMNQPKRAIPYMERSTRMAPDRPAFLVGLGNQYRETGRPRDARAAYERALGLDPADVEALTALGEVVLDAGERERAAALADRALKVAPSDERARALAARARRQP
jgi:spermidine synthase